MTVWPSKGAKRSGVKWGVVAYAIQIDSGKSADSTTAEASDSTTQMFLFSHTDLLDLTDFFCSAKDDLFSNGYGGKAATQPLSVRSVGSV